MTTQVPTEYSITPHSRSTEETLAGLHSSIHGLDHAEASKRQKQFGLNTLPRAKEPSVVQIFLRQFVSPLIYILAAAAIFSIFSWEKTFAQVLFKM